jgi:hypothetical protein
MPATVAQPAGYLTLGSTRSPIFQFSYRVTKQNTNLKGVGRKIIGVVERKLVYTLNIWGLFDTTKWLRQSKHGAIGCLIEPPPGIVGNYPNLPVP